MPGKASCAIVMLLPAASGAAASAAPEPAPVPAATASAAPGGFGAANWAVLAAYLAVLVAMGAYFSRREKSTDDYFLAGRRIPWWAAGLSIFGGGLSALTYMSVPGTAFKGDWVMLLTYVVPVALIPAVVAFYIPFYRRLRVTTAYEYLERRFNLPVRLFASGYYILFQFGRMAIMLVLPALALATVAGMNVYACILIMGVLALAYTLLGGIEAVVWTDVLQVIVLAGGALLVLGAIAFQTDGGLGGIIDSAAEHGKFRTFAREWSWTKEAVWVIVLGSLFSAVMPNTADQSVVQRYLATRDERSAARAAWASALLGIPTGLLFFFLGTALFVFYRLHHPGLLPHNQDPDAVLALFVVQQLPRGLSGLVIAGIFAAAMSTIDNGMNAIATAFTTDFYRRGRPGRDERHYLNVARLATLGAGVIATAAAVVLRGQDVRLMFQFFYRLLGLFGGTLAGLFVLGIFTRRASGPGALAGAIASMAAACLVKYATNLHWMLHSVVGLTGCVAVGYLASFLPFKRKDLAGLTVYTMPPEEGR